MVKLKEKSVCISFSSRHNVGFVLFPMYLRLVLFQLLLSTSAHGFDLLSSLMAQSPSLPNIKSLVSPDMLSKMKGLLPSLPPGQSHGPADVAQIEKLLAKLKPAEGRFDPQMLELLAHMDNSRVHHYPNSQHKRGSKKDGKNPNNFNNNHEHDSDNEYHHDHHEHQHEHENDHDMNEHHHDERILDLEKSMSTSTSSDVFPFTTTDGKPKFSSKFRLDEAKEPSENHHHHHNQQQQLLDLDHVIDPNIRNHRLYDLDQERFETYENFTALDQVEDLLAEESNLHGSGVEVVVPPPPDSKMRIRHAPSTSATTPVSNKGWIGRPYSSIRRSTPKTRTSGNSLPEPTPTTFSYEEEMVSMDTSMMGDDEYSSSSSQVLHDREPLKHSSTEKTVIYPQNHHIHLGQNQNHQSRRNQHMKHQQSSNGNDHGENSDEMLAESSSTTSRFKPSPIDLVAATPPAVSFEPDQDFYTSTISKKKSGRRRQNQNAMEKSSAAPSPPFHHHYPQNSNGHDYAASTDLNIYSDQTDYPKEPPNFNPYPHTMNYPKPNHNIHPSMSPAVDPQIMHHPHPHAHPSQSHPGPHNNNMPMINPNMKQDRILPGGFQQVQQTFANLPAMFYSGANAALDMTTNRLRNGYVAEGSENVYHDVQMNPYRTQLQSPSHSNYQQHGQGQGYGHGQGQGQQHDLAYSAGQNYYTGHGHYPAHGHYEDGSSSWTSTFFLLGGLIALSAVIAFLLPSILTSSGITGGGKDTGDDKIDSGDEPDLWTEIKGLYGDIVSIAKGDYANFNRQRVNRHRNNLVNIVEEDDNEQENENENEEDPTRIGKRRGQAGKLVDGLGKPGANRGQKQNQNKNQLQRRKLGQGEEVEEEDEEIDAEDAEDQEQEEEEDSATLPSSSRTSDNLHDSIEVESEDENKSRSVEKNEKETKEKREKTENINDTLAFGVQSQQPGFNTFFNRSQGGMDFANAFNQTLQAWEKVPLIAN